MLLNACKSLPARYWFLDLTLHNATILLTALE